MESSAYGESANLSGINRTAGAVDDRLVQRKKSLHQKLITNVNLSVLSSMSQEERERELRKAAEEMCEYASDLLSYTEREWLVNEVLDEAFGLGPLEPLMKDPAISDIMINGPATIYVERQGRLEQVPISFDDDRHLVQTVQRLVSRVGRHVDEMTPMVDARLPDGSRINAVIPPLALDGALVSIRRFGGAPLQILDLVEKQALMPEMAQFLTACIQARLNVVISGGTGSGKTTLLNALSASIPADERIVTIEDAAELRLQQPHIARMETRPRNTEGVGEVTTRDLVRNALRMRPDRIIIGECRGPEALDMLQAMNTGHDGSMTTIHANDTRDVISRLEMMVGMAGMEVPIWIIRRQIASAVHLIVQVSRLRGGARKIVKISELTGMEGDVVSMQDIFGYKQTGVDEKGNPQGQFFSTNLRPQCLEDLEAAGAKLSLDMFDGWSVSAQ